MTDISDFWSSYVFDDEIPDHLRHFLKVDKSANSWAQTTGYYAHGYAYAFERLIMIAISMWPNAEYLRMPVFFLARHAAELHLKDVIREFSAVNGTPDIASNEHRLVPLWTRATAQILAAGYPVDDDWSLHVGKLIQHMHDFDPSGQRFRYPEDNTGKQFARTLVELKDLGGAHAAITLWCEAAIDMLQAAQS